MPTPPNRGNSNSALPNRFSINIPEMNSFEDVRQALSQVLSDFQQKLLAQFPITNYGGKRISNVAVPVGADDVVTLRYLLGQQLPPPANNVTGKSGPGYDKATFGLLAPLTVTNALTNYYICENAGTFLYTKIKIHDQVPTGSDAHLDIKLSTDDAATFNSIYTSNIVLPAGSSTTVTVTNFAIPTIAVGNLLRIDCTQAGSTNPGKGIEVVTKWALGS